MNRRILCLFVCWLALALSPYAVVFGQSETVRPTSRQLQRWLKQYPKADADRDGVLTIQEAEAYRQKVAGEAKRKATKREPAYGFRVEYPFATLTDGVRIALAVGFPRGYDGADADKKWPAMLNMMGYPGSTEPEPPGRFNHRYVTVRASLRGAGASGGAIQPISRRNGLDGYEIIENWIVKQPWSNGRVALHGHSWGGLTGFMIAATHPPHLKAVAVSGLLDDVYRDIGRIGGIRNSGFPIDWMNQLYSPTGPFESGLAAMRARGLTEDQYEQIVQTRPPLDFAQSLLWKLLVSAQDPPESRDASPGEFARQIQAPIQIMHSWQDEQTGPSGVWLWTYIPDSVPKQLILSNGEHATVGMFGEQRSRWLDYWTLDHNQNTVSDLTELARRVRVYFETDRDSADLNRPLVAASFPLPETAWKRFYLDAGGRLSDVSPGTDARLQNSGDSYQVIPGVPDAELSRIAYTLKFERPTALCGPIAVSLWAQCTSLDTDLFVTLVDVDSRGTIQYLQRGMLRASHRQLDEKRSGWVTLDGKETLIRPRHVHRDLVPLVPHKPYRFDIEIYPIGHVVREGHRLGLWISQPPIADPVVRSRRGGPSYLYASDPPRGVVTILRSDAYPSSILLPLLPTLPPISKQPPGAGDQAGIHVDAN